jgi:hypothetical protein
MPWRDAARRHRAQLQLARVVGLPGQRHGHVLRHRPVPNCGSAARADRATQLRADGHEPEGLCCNQGVITRSARSQLANALCALLRVPQCHASGHCQREPDGKLLRHSARG